MEGFQELIAEIGQPCTQFSLAHNESTKYYWVSVVYPQKDIPGYGLLVNGIDHLGPQAVQLQSSACDSMGIIRVNWRPGKEKDLLGYQIYTSNRRHSEFSNVSKSWTTDTFFVDTLDISWNRDSVYYFIKAADTRYNQSTDDSVVAIAIPVINPPEIPFISSCSEYMGSIRLFIERSPHDRAAFVKVYRKENHGEWLSLALVRKVESSFFIDSHVTSGNYYEYKCCATGNTGIQSGFSPTVSYLLTKTEMLDKIEFSEIWNDTISHKITFKWPKNSFDITAYRIIEVSQGHSKTIATIDGTQTSAQIKYNKPTEGSSYYLIGYTSDGRRSKI
jgi:uncharacterized protein